MHKHLNWHGSIFPPPENKSIFRSLPSALVESASKWPDSPAVVSNGKNYSFSDLVSRIAGLSDELNESGRDSGPVALILKDGFDAIAAWFACSLSRRPFLLLEPDHPPARLRELIDISGCTLVLVDSTTSQLSIHFPELNRLISDGRFGTFPQEKGLGPEDTAMIFPTSGSTGNPKLIAYAATTIQVKVQSSIELMRVPSGARVLIAGSHNNYGFLHHALVFLFSGGSVCLTDIKATGFEGVQNGIIQLGVRHVRFTPSLFRKFAAMPQACEALRLLEGVRFSGEPLLKSDLKLAYSVLKPGCLIQNVYGSTESALFIWSSTDPTWNDTEPTAPIGKIYPLASFAIHPLEVGEQDALVGELLIRSPFHALGDLEKGVIDKERFPRVDENTDDRIYATGDIVRQRSDGNLIHLGRLTRMVKIRGNRVFLSEIENHLRSIPGVTGAAVVEHADLDDTVLYGFITAEKTPITTDDSRSYLASRLPDFMIPKIIEVVPQIPLMTGGKVDYQSLMNQLPKFNRKTNASKGVDEYDRLIQLWDSVLWEGAHLQNSDFLSLGGDSVGLMVLSAEVERAFGKKLLLEELRSSSTLPKLASLLGIKIPGVESEQKSETIQTRLVAPSLRASKGIALAMPGYNGCAQAYPFQEAQWFEDHDIWTVDFSIHEGSMAHDKRWRIAAFEIVKNIQEGKIPSPRVIFGYSIGGSVAWLVGRLLSGSPQCPEFVVMVDAPALHRSRGFRDRQLHKALKDVYYLSPPATVHIRRAPVSASKFDRGAHQLWRPKDNIRMLIDLPTVDHFEMLRCDVLSLAKEALATFVDSGQVNSHLQPTCQPPDIMGVHIYSAIRGNEASFQKVVKGLSENLDLLNIEKIVNLSILMVSKKEKDMGIQLIEFARNKWPASGVTQFLYRRMRRNANMLLALRIPRVCAFDIFTFENRLMKSQGNIDRSKPLPIRLIVYAYDVFSSFVSSRLTSSREYRSKS